MYQDTYQDTLAGQSFNVFARCRITELQQVHVSELAHLQRAHASELVASRQALQEERGKREAAESSLQAQRDVSISMEDVQPIAGSTGSWTQPTTLGKWAGRWVCASTGGGHRNGQVGGCVQALGVGSSPPHWADRWEYEVCKVDKMIHNML